MEWDDDQRNLMAGLTAYEAHVCSGCGWHEAVARDKANYFTFAEERCPVCAGHARLGRIHAASDERHRKALGDHPPADRVEPGDGRKVLSRLMSPEEVARRKGKS